MKEENKKMLDSIIKEKIEKGEKVICDKQYYKNQMLQYAMKRHTLLPCIIKCYIEQLMTAAKSGLSPNPALDLKHANCELVFLSIYTNRTQQKLISSTFLNFLEKIPRNLENKFRHILAEYFSRLKSFKSVEANIRQSMLEIEVYKDIINNIDTLFSSIDESEKNELRKLLRTKINYLTIDNILSDIIGYRYVVHSVDSSTDEAVLIKALYEIQYTLDNYLDEIGFGTFIIKDYIKDPKVDENGNEYKSLHSKADIQSWTVETQLRTFRMHEEAENGSVAHTKYKNTPIYRFLKQFLSDVSKKTEKEDINRIIGLTQEVQIDKLLTLPEPKEEIPLTPIQVEEFEDLKFLFKVFKVFSK